MKRNIIIMSIVALMGLWFPTFAAAEDDGTHAADVTTDDWGDDGDTTLNFDFGGDTTGVDEVAASGSSLRIGVEGGEIVVWSAESRLLPICDLRGAVVSVAQVQEGRNAVEAPGRGIFIIGGKKVML